MSVPFTCPHCGAQTSVDEQYLGQSGPCYHCGRTVTVTAVWGSAAASPSSGAGSAGIVIAVLAVVLIVGGLFCAGMMTFLFARRSAPSVSFQFSPQTTAPWGAMPAVEEFEVDAVSNPKQYYRSPAPERFTRVHLEPTDGALPALLAAEAAKAKAAGRKPFVQVGLSTSLFCRQLDESLGDPRMIDAFDGTYIIHLDLDEWCDIEPEYSFPMTGIPAFFEIDGQGNATGRTIGDEAWAENTPQSLAPPLKEFFQGADQSVP